MEKTLKELIIHIIDDEGNVSAQYVLKLLQQVRESTKIEIENKANEYGEIATADYISDIPTDRIKLTEKQ